MQVTEKVFQTPLNIHGNKVEKKTFFHIPHKINENIFWSEYGFIEYLNQGTQKEFQEQLFELSNTPDPLNFPTQNPTIRWGLEFLKFQINQPEFGPVQTLIQGLYFPGDNYQLKKFHEGLKYLKVKLGSDIKKNIIWIKSCLKNNPHIFLRIDSNGRWSENDLFEIHHSLSKAEQNQIDYYEEPIRESYQLLLKDHTLPIAIDESLIEAINCQDRWKTKPKSLVVKPTLYELNPIIKACPDLPITLSSTFESPFAHQYHLITANKLGSHTYHGLDTLHSFVGNWEGRQFINEAPNYQKLNALQSFS